MCRMEAESLLFVLELDHLAGLEKASERNCAPAAFPILEMEGAALR